MHPKAAKLFDARGTGIVPGAISPDLVCFLACGPRQGLQHIVLVPTATPETMRLSAPISSVGPRAT